MLLDHADLPTADPANSAEAHDVARLRLVCVVRSGDGYVVRAVGRLSEANARRRHLDIAFGDAADRAHAAELDAAVRRVHRWCEDGTAVVLVESGAGLTLRAGDGTEVQLPGSA